MNKHITPEARESLGEVIDAWFAIARDHSDLNDSCDTPELAEKIVKWYEGVTAPSYSELIIEGNEAKKTCGQCGQLCVAYKEKFRKGWLDCLQALKNNGGLTYKQLANILERDSGYKNKAANNLARTFTLMTHWQVIEKTPYRVGRCPIYAITDFGKEVLFNESSIPEFVWIPARNVAIDRNLLPQAPYTFACGIKPDDPDALADKAAHFAEAVSALPEF